MNQRTWIQNKNSNSLKNLRKNGSEGFITEEKKEMLYSEYSDLLGQICVSFMQNKTKISHNTTANKRNRSFKLFVINDWS